MTHCHVIAVPMKLGVQSVLTPVSKAPTERQGIESNNKQQATQTSLTKQAQIH
jgi:hypothetical protein